MDTELLHRMKSIRQTVQISSAQKLVAAAHVGKARKMLEDSRPYHDTVSSAIADVLRQCPEISSRYLTQGYEAGGRRGLLVLSANRGLAGGFNSNIIHFTEQALADKPADYVIVLGKAARAHLIRKGYPVDEGYDLPLDPPTMATARDLANKMVGMLEREEIDAFDIIYTAYRSSVRMEPVLRRLFPLDPSVFDNYKKDKSSYSFEPSPEHLLAFMITKYLKGYIYGCLIYSHICELTSRLTAMDAAIRNGNEMLEHLSLLYNRARQGAITQEITEIVAGAMALQVEE